MWTHVQLAWWWYLELRRDRNVICIMRYEPNLVLGWVVEEYTSVQLSPLKKTFESTWVLVPLRKEEDSLQSLVSCKQLLSLSTLLLVGLSSLLCLSSSPWKMVLSLLTVLGLAKLWWLVLESEELDKHNMVLPSLWGTSCTVEQWWQKAYTLNTWFEHWLLCPLLRSILNMYLHTSQKCWERWSDDLDNQQDVREAIAIKWVYQYKWPTYYSSYYCIDAMKQYRCIAKIQITLCCNMANWSLFAGYVLYHDKNDN